jgi:hypothetical protein
MDIVVHRWWRGSNDCRLHIACRWTSSVQEKCSGEALTISRLKIAKRRAKTVQLAGYTRRSNLTPRHRRQPGPIGRRRRGGRAEETSKQAKGEATMDNPNDPPQLARFEVSEDHNTYRCGAFQLEFSGDEHGWQRSDLSFKHESFCDLTLGVLQALRAIIDKVLARFANS